MTEQQLHMDAVVYDMSGAPIGTLYGYDARSDCVVVRQGVVPYADLYIPLGDVRGNDARGDMHLRLYKADLAGDRYAHPYSGARA